jgi:hypothetical protein
LYIFPSSNKPLGYFRFKIGVKALTITALTLLTDKEKLKEIKDEFEKVKNN